MYHSTYITQAAGPLLADARSEGGPVETQPRRREKLPRSLPAIFWSLPEQFQSELHLARGGGSAGNHARRWRNARGSEDNGIGLVEIRPVKKVEYLRAKLKTQPLTNSHFFQHGEIPRGQARPDQGVSSNVAIESSVGSRVRRRQKRSRVEPLVRTAKDHWPCKGRVRERAHRIPCIPIIRRVVAELRRKREAALQCHDGVYRPTARH